MDKLTYKGCQFCGAPRPTVSHRRVASGPHHWMPLKSRIGGPCGLTFKEAYELGLENHVAALREANNCVVELCHVCSARVPLRVAQWSRTDVSESMKYLRVVLRAYLVQGDKEAVLAVFDEAAEMIEE